MASFSALYSLEEVPVEWGRPSIECWEDTSHQPLVVGLTNHHVPCEAVPNKQFSWLHNSYSKNEKKKR